jgi:hypothetical protein
MKTITILTLCVLLPGCSSMTADERAFWLRTGERVVVIGLDRLSTKHPQK